MPIDKYFKGSGSKVMKSLKGRYGDKDGERVFYALSNSRQGMKPKKEQRVIAPTADGWAVMEGEEVIGTARELRGARALLQEDWAGFDANRPSDAGGDAGGGYHMQSQTSSPASNSLLASAGDQRPNPAAQAAAAYAARGGAHGTQTTYAKAAGGHTVKINQGHGKATVFHGHAGDGGKLKAVHHGTPHSAAKFVKAKFGIHHTLPAAGHGTQGGKGGKSGSKPYIQGGGKGNKGKSIKGVGVARPLGRMALAGGGHPRGRHWAPDAYVGRKRIN